MKKEIRSLQSFTFVVLGIIIAAVAAIASLGVFGQLAGKENIEYVSIGIAALALILASVALSFALVKRTKK